MVEIRLILIIALLMSNRQCLTTLEPINQPKLSPSAAPEFGENGDETFTDLYPGRVIVTAEATSYQYQVNILIGIFLLPIFNYQHCYEQLKKIVMSPEYDRFFAPFPSDRSTLNITAGIFVEGISSVQTVTMDFITDIFFVLRWVDERLKYTCDLPEDSFTILANDLSITLWTPGIYFANSKDDKFHDVMKMNSNAFIWSDGSIRTSTRITLKVICNMNLEVYPFDTQRCEIKFMDYNYPNSMINVTWMSDDVESPIALSKYIVIPEMVISETMIDYCDGNYPAGVWSCLMLTIVLSRVTASHLYQTYLPSALIAVISFTSFWLDIDAVPGRVSLSITTLLTLTTQASSLRMSLPNVSYMKAVDVWMILCQFFVLGVLLEFTVVNYISRSYTSIEVNHSWLPFKRNSINVHPIEKQSGTDDNRLRAEAGIKLLCRQRAESIDQISKTAFPLVFIVVNIGYWTYYMKRAGLY